MFPLLVKVITTNCCCSTTKSKETFSRCRKTALQSTGHLRLHTTTAIHGPTRCCSTTWYGRPTRRWTWYGRSTRRWTWYGRRWTWYGRCGWSSATSTGPSCSTTAAPLSPSASSASRSRSLRVLKRTHTSTGITGSNLFVFRY